jgi:hypothetical protein
MWKQRQNVALNCARRLVFEPLESRELLTTLPAGFDFAPDGHMFIANKVSPCDDHRARWHGERRH